MVSVISKPDTYQKLEILSTDARYDLACACGSNKNEHRTRGSDGKWIYPVTTPSGQRGSLFRTLVSNTCVNDCKYCPLRAQNDVRRCRLKPEETARAFMDYLQAGKVFGLFLTSGVTANADRTMEDLNSTAAIIRNHYGFRGYIHLKVIPGASDAAVEDALSLASSVSINIETPGAQYFAKLSSKKDYEKDIIRPLKLISKLTSPGERFANRSHTTQFIVGAADEKDSDIIRYTGALYDRLNSHRVYFSAYQAGLGDASLPGEKSVSIDPQNSFIREHRLYQADFLLRKYGFSDSEFFFGPDGNLSLTADPKETWANHHPEFFPVDINKASKFDLLRVPGLGPVMVKSILQMRKSGKIRSILELGRAGKRLEKAAKYIKFSF
jgi:predicted DNA-binding helix-hairpin-helix protein